MNATQIAVTAIVWGAIVTIYPRAAGPILVIAGVVYLTIGWVPFAGWSWSQP